MSFHFLKNIANISNSQILTSSASFLIIQDAKDST